MSYNKYLYSGPVLEFGTVISPKWTAITSAESEAKAKNNLKYRFKKENNRSKSSKIALPGKLLIINDSRKDDGEQLIFDCLTDLFKQRRR